MFDAIPLTLSLDPQREQRPARLIFPSRIALLMALEAR